MGNGVIVIWVGTNSSVPANFTRATALDGKFAKGASSSANAGDTGGSDYHSHTSAEHGHTLDDHVHVVSLNSITPNGSSAGTTSSNGPKDSHGHNAVNSGARVGGTLSSVTSEYQSTTHNNLPPYYDVIYIASDGTTVIPNLAVAFWDGETLPAGWYDCDGNNSTPNLVGKFLRGADTGQDAGGAGGSISHVHIIHHTHTETAHSHARVQSGSYTATTKFETAGGTADAVQAHSHDIDLDNNTVGFSGDPNSSSLDIELSNSAIRAIQNRSGNFELPAGIICLWRGTRASIPAGWQEYTPLRDVYAKVTATYSEVGVTSGSLEHSHTDNHIHTSNGAHTHTATVEYQTNTNNAYNSGNSLPKAHTHTANVGTATADWGSASTVGDISSHEPPYSTVIYIRYVGLTVRVATTALVEGQRVNTFSATAELDAALMPAQGEYQWILYNRAEDKNIADITDARDKSFELYLNEEGNAKFKLNLSNLLASSEFIKLGEVELHIYRNNTRVWGGELAQFEGKLTEGDEDFTVTARSFESLFKSRYTGAYREFTNTDAGQIAWALVNESQALTDGDFGVASGEIQPSVNRTRTYTYKPIYEALVQLSEVRYGIDWEVTPNKQFNVFYPRKGVDRSALDLLEWGANVEEVSFGYNFTKPVNKAIVLGAGEGASISYSVRTDTTARSKYKLREEVVSYKDVSDQTTLDDKGDQVLTEQKDPIEALEIVQARGAGILAFTRLNLGDDVYVKVNQGLISVNDSYRIRGLKVEIADDGTEKVTYVLSKTSKINTDILDDIRSMQEQLAIWASTNYAVNS